MADHDRLLHRALFQMEPMNHQRRKDSNDLRLSPSSVMQTNDNEETTTVTVRSSHSCFLRFAFVTLPTFLFIGIRLSLYVLVLIPLFLRFCFYYTIASRRKVVRYASDSMRQTLDVFDPVIVTNETPIVFFVCGGAWIIGYKMWGALMARVLTKAGVTVILVDYRNYPFGIVSDMMDDVRMALEWTTQWRRPIIAVGQSAGSHLLVTFILRQALHIQTRELLQDDEMIMEPLVSNQYLKGLIVLSAPLDLEAMRVRFGQFGLDEGLVDRIFGHNIEQYDAMQLLARLNLSTIQTLPPMRIYHGTADTTVPVQISKDFCRTFQNMRPLDDVRYYEGWSHTDPILEGPADADHRFHRDVFDAVCEWSPIGNNALLWPDDNDPVLQRLSLHSLVQLARWFMPF